MPANTTGAAFICLSGAVCLSAVCNLRPSQGDDELPEAHANHRADEEVALFNSPLARNQAAAFAHRLLADCGGEHEYLVDRAW